MTGRPPRSPLFPHPPLSHSELHVGLAEPERALGVEASAEPLPAEIPVKRHRQAWFTVRKHDLRAQQTRGEHEGSVDRKSTRLNSSHLVISYAVFCLKKKKHH